MLFRSVVRTARALEAAGTVDAIGFNKTGTLTYGALDVVEVKPAPIAAMDASTVLRLAAMVESRSEHPIAMAVVRKASLTSQDFETVDEFRAIVGSGVVASVDEQEVAVGRPTWVASLGANLEPIGIDLARYASAGQRAVVVAANNGAGTPWRVAGTKIGRAHV